MPHSQVNLQHCYKTSKIVLDTKLSACNSRKDLKKKPKKQAGKN